MTRNQIHSNFIAFMEQVRYERNLTIAEMAKLLEVSESTYRNIIYRKTGTIDIAIACKLYDLTHKWMWTMCGYETSGFEVLDLYTELSEERQDLMRKMVLLVSVLK